MKIKQGFKLRPLGDEFILIGEGLEQINFNKMITMNTSAAYLWNKVADGSSFDMQRMASLLTDEYDVSTADALRDANATIQAWQNAGIIE